MNSTFKIKRWQLTLFGALLLVFAACVQGPWEYSPEEEEPYRGLYVNGYVMAGEPITRFCVERSLELTEYAVQGYAWYHKEEVGVRGDFGLGEEKLLLRPLLQNPSCFAGPAEKIPIKGEDYQLEALFEWDSSGYRVESYFEATAHVPTKFSIRDTVWVVAAALRPIEEVDEGSPDPLQFFFSLPPEVIQQLSISFPGLDSALADPVYGDKWFEENGTLLYATAGKYLLSYEKKIPCVRGDTISYLSGNLNFVSHLFSADPSEDVAGVLLSQRLSAEVIWPENSFSSILGSEPEAATRHKAGDVRKLQFTAANVSSSKEGISLLDSLPVINSFLHGGRNRLIFYGMEKAYRDFLGVEKISNIEGAFGYFVGGVVDSFDLVVRIPAKGGFSGLESHADYCKKNGWSSSKDCRLFEPTYCQHVGWNDSLWIVQHPELMSGKTKSFQDCYEDGLGRGFDDSSWEKVMESRLTGSRLSEESKAQVKKVGVERGCTRTFFGREGGDSTRCAPLFESYFRSKSPPEKSGSHLFLWCEDRDWLPEVCLPTARQYCASGTIRSSSLCGAAELWCEEHSVDRFCK